MLDNIKAKLIRLFAARSTAEIMANKANILEKTLGTRNYRKMAKDDSYNIYFEKLQWLRDDLDAELEGTCGRDQVKACLRQLRSRDVEDFELLAKLVNLGLYKHWTKRERDYYDTGLNMLTGWKDFFLSYTNRNLNETNNDFKNILRDVYGETIFNKLKETVNCVARLVFHYLRMNNLTAFYDKDTMKCGDEVEEKILNYCQSVFAFVQLVEPVIFQAPDDDKRNWCYEEFRVFDKWSQQEPVRNYKRFYFILNREDVYPVRVPLEYKDWKHTIENHVNIVLESMEKEQIRLKVKETADEIEKTRKQILDAYID